MGKHLRTYAQPGFRARGEHCAHHGVPGEERAPRLGVGQYAGKHVPPEVGQLGPRADNAPPAPHDHLVWTNILEADLQPLEFHAPGLRENDPRRDKVRRTRAVS